MLLRPRDTTLKSARSQSDLVRSGRPEVSLRRPGVTAKRRKVGHTDAKHLRLGRVDFDLAVSLSVRI